MTSYIRYHLKTLEPLRIADDSRSQSGQAITQDYIPGSTVRGYIINSLAAQAREKERTGQEHFDQIKPVLFSAQVRFGNAYLSITDTDGSVHDLIPSPKGFYEDKKETVGRKRLQNVVVSGDFEKGNKRASLGGYAFFEDQTIHYYSVTTGSDLKILMNADDDEGRNIFRNDYVVPGTVLAGDIAVPEEIAEEILSVWTGTVTLGNARSSGYGKCAVLDCHMAEEPLYTEYAAQQNQEKECYLYLLSDTVMRNQIGQYCGLDLPTLEQVLGVRDLVIERCSTSTVHVRGYNRQYGGKLPDIPMYQAGSVFRLRYTGTLQADRAAVLLSEGIGVRRNEGFGKAVISEDYADLLYKMAGTWQKEKTPASAHQEDEATCRIIAQGWYRQRLRQEMSQYVTEPAHSLQAKGASSSQIGSLEAYTVGYRNDPFLATEKIRNYVTHSNDKASRNRVHEKKSTLSVFGKDILAILDQDLEETLQSSLQHILVIMGINKKELISAEELQGMKLDLITMMIRYHNKEDHNPSGEEEH